MAGVNEMLLALYPDGGWAATSKAILLWERAEPQPTLLELQATWKEYVPPSPQPTMEERIAALEAKRI